MSSVIEPQRDALDRDIEASLGVYKEDAFARSIADEALAQRKESLIAMVNAWLRNTCMSALRAAVVRSRTLHRSEHNVPGHFIQYHVMSLPFSRNLKLLRILRTASMEEQFPLEHDRFNLVIDGWLVEEVEDDNGDSTLHFRAEGSFWRRLAGTSITTPTLSTGGVWILQLVGPKRATQPNGFRHGHPHH